MRMPGKDATPAEWGRFWRWNLIENLMKIGVVLGIGALIFGWLLVR